MQKQGFQFNILRLLAHQLQNWADFVSRQAGEDERSDARERANIETAQTASEADDSSVGSSVEPDMGSVNTQETPSDWLARLSAAEPPADWLARVQKDAPSLLAQQASPSRSLPKQSQILPATEADNKGQVVDAEISQDRNVVAQSHTQPSVSTVGNAPVTDAEIGQRGHMTETMPVVKDSSEPVTKNKPEREENKVHRDKGDVPASALQQRDLGEIGQDREIVQSSNQDGLSTSSSQAGSPGQSVEQEDSAQEARAQIDASPNTVHNRWPQTGLAEPAYGNSWPQVSMSEASEQIQSVLRWPSLPDEEMADDQDWEMARRSWERQRRLDEEQRGRAWNV